jgi:hypothetical protein
MLLDYYLQPDMLYHPRTILTSFQSQSRDPLKQLIEKKNQFQSNNNNNNNNKRLAAPHQQQLPSSSDNIAVHLRLMADVMSDGILSLQHASGVCFRRIAWGHGPHMFYTATMQKLRRLVARFARLLALKLMNYHSELHGGVQHVFWHRWDEQQSASKPSSSSSSTAKSRFVNVHGEPLKVLVYTRGNSGRGRTIQKEDLIIEALQARGAQAFICCSFQNTSLEQQLYYALHADIVSDCDFYDFEYSLI